MSTSPAIGAPIDRWSWRNPLPPDNPLTAVTHANGTFVAVGAYLGLILTSGDGTNWVQQRSPINEISVEEYGPRTLNAVAYGDGRWVAVGSAGIIATSPDARCWTAQSSGTAEHLTAVSYGDGAFVAVGAAGTILRSIDGVVWQRQNSGTNVFLRGIGYGNGTWVVVGGDISAFGIPDNHIILTSAGGVTWVDRSASIPILTQSLHGVAYGNNTFVIVGWTTETDEGLLIFTSTDGSDWTQQNSGIYGWQYLDLTAIVFANDTFVTGGRAGILSSPDGSNWTHRVSRTDDFFGNGIAYGNNAWVIAHRSPAKVETSYDMVTWHQQRSGTPKPLFGIEVTNDLAVVVGVEGTILTSSNGFKWTIEASGTSRNLYGVAHHGNLWVVAGGEGAILTSSNGSAWTSQNSGTTNWLFDVQFGADQFVAAGWYGSILSSPDGKIWTSRMPVTSQHLQAVAYGNGTWVAAGDGGVILSSNDGTAWTQRSSGLATYLYGVRYIQGRWIAVGAAISGGTQKSVVLISYDAVNWIRQDLPTGATLRDVTFGDGYFVITGRPFFGKPSTIFTSPDGTNWTLRIPDSFSLLNGVGYAWNTFIVIGDGVILQSDPVGGSPTRLEGPFRNSSGSYDLVLRSERTGPFRLEATGDFGSWDEVGTASNCCGCASFRDETGTNYARRYYRAVEVTP